jgi:hypothetical protein
LWAVVNYDAGMLLVITLACGSAVDERSLPIPGHANEWDALVAAADRGDIATVKVMARDFSLGTVSDDHPSAVKLGGAMGFLQLVDDPEDLGPAITQAKEACTECHLARGVPEKSAP